MAPNYPIMIAELHGLDHKALVGIIVGIVLALVVLLFVSLWLFKRLVTSISKLFADSEPRLLIS